MYSHVQIIDIDVKYIFYVLYVKYSMCS